jgi:hypothetical protein
VRFSWCLAMIGLRPACETRGRSTALRVTSGVLPSSVVLLGADVIELVDPTIARGEPFAASEPVDECVPCFEIHVHSLIPGLGFCAVPQRTDGWEVGRIDRSVQDTEYRYILHYRLISAITQGSVNYFV